MLSSNHDGGPRSQALSTPPKTSAGSTQPNSHTRKAYMSSDLRLRANRANAARSTGPVTAEGKAQSSRNARRHGLLSRQVLVGKESPAAFKALFDLFIARWSPVDDVELGLIEEMAAASWRLRRVWALESEMLESAMESHTDRRHLTRMAAA